MKQFSTMMAFLVGITSVAPVSATDNLSVSEATVAIWKMKYEDICSLHKEVFPDEYVDKREAFNCVQKVSLKISGCIDKAKERISTMCKAVRAKIFGKTMVMRVLDTLKSAMPMEQEIIKEAVSGSYKEYELSTVELIFGAIMTVITGPIGLFVLCSIHRDHIKKIEAQRALATERSFNE